LPSERLGDRFAELMIKALPPDPEQLATKGDLAVLGGVLRTEMADLRTDLRTEMAELRTALKTDMADLRTEMADLRTELKTEMADLRTEMADLPTAVRTESASLRVEMRDLTAQQTRTLATGLVGSHHRPGHHAAHPRRHRLTPRRRGAGRSGGKTEGSRSRGDGPAPHLSLVQPTGRGDVRCRARCALGGGSGGRPRSGDVLIIMPWPPASVQQFSQMPTI